MVSRGLIDDLSLEHGFPLVDDGSGDAAEAIPVRIVPGWEQVALRIGIDDAMAGAIDFA